MKTIVKFLLVAAMGLTTGLVSAKLFGKLTTPSGIMVLFHDDQQYCPEGSRAAEVHMPLPDNRKLKACWKFTPQGAIFIVDEEGDGGLLDPNRVEELKGV